MTKSKPVTPSEVAQSVTNEDLPDAVIDVFNDLIRQNIRGKVARVDQREAATRTATALGISVQSLYERKLMDVEKHYEKAGWRVVHHQPIAHGGEDFAPYYEFTSTLRGV